MNRILQNIRAVLVVLLMVAGVSNASGFAAKVDVTASATTVEAGTEITITVINTGDNFNPTVYEFYYKKDDVDVLIQTGSSTEAKFMPTQAGTYLCYVKAKQDDIIVSNSCEVTSTAVEPHVILTVSPTENLHPGTEITLTATPICCSPTEYIFYAYDPYSNTILSLSSPSEENTLTYTPVKSANIKYYVNYSFMYEGNELTKKSPYSDFFNITNPETVTITPNENGVLSFVAYNALDFSGVEGLEAYVATGVTTSSVTLKKVDKVTWLEAFVVKGENKDYSVPVIEDFQHEQGYVNLFSRSLGTEKAGALGDNIYCLNTSGQFQRVHSSVVIPANKAYLTVNDSWAKTLTLDFGDDDDTPTAIQSVNSQQSSAKSAMKVVKDGRMVIETANGTFNAVGARIK